MKAQTLQIRLPPGTEVEFQLAGGARLRGRVIAVEDELVALDTGGSTHHVFVADISGFALLSQVAVQSKGERLVATSQPQESTAAQPGPEQPPRDRRLEKSGVWTDVFLL
ncbi:MAG: hypothetical protein QOD99_2352, partial [Chthoniobacter sp.]|nr:hypothetical protein [Chthoniobacter sp.]